jgi:hypothetical protein
MQCTLVNLVQCDGKTKESVMHDWHQQLYEGEAVRKQLAENTDNIKIWIIKLQWKKPKSESWQ